MLALGPDTCCFVCIKYVRYPWWPALFEWFRHLCFVYCAWAGFSGGKAQENDCHSLCFCSMSQCQWWGQWLITSASTECTLSSNIAMYIYQHAIVPTNNRFYNKPCYGSSFLASTLVFSQHRGILAYSTCALCWPLRATESDSMLWAKLGTGHGNS